MIRFQQQHYGDESMWRGTQAQEQNYAFHEESWSSDNNCHNKKLQHFPGMHMNKLGANFSMDSDISMSKHHNMLGGNHGMFHNDLHRDHGFGYGHGGGRKYPFGGNNSSYHFQNGGGVGGKFGSGGHHEYYSEETEYNEAYAEEHVGAVAVDEMRYEHHNYQGGDTYYVNPCERNRIKYMNHKPHKVQWIAKGV